MGSRERQIHILLAAAGNKAAITHSDERLLVAFVWEKDETRRDGKVWCLKPRLILRTGLAMRTEVRSIVDRRYGRRTLLKGGHS
jgi:hypothetical protein